jgi:hypothetical protein
MRFRDPYIKDEGFTPDSAALVEYMRRLNETTRQMHRSIRRLSSTLILLVVVVIAVGVADHWPTVRIVLAAVDQWRQQWWH